MNKIIKVKCIAYTGETIKEHVYITTNYGVAAGRFETENKDFIKENKGIIHHYDFEEIRKY